MTNEWWGLVAVVGAWGWVLSGAGFILTAFPSRDRFNGRPALLWGGSFLFFYLLWVVGMKVA